MKKKAFYNIAASMALEIVSVVCAFILPRLIISGFGSQYNGIVSSVTQFLSVITLLRGGVGGVTRAALYKPLVEKDNKKISAILNSTQHFMRKISYIFVGFLFVFAVIYPVLVSNEFDYFFSFSLVLILGISTFAQYYFGITYQFLLMADQRNYIYSIFQTVATILNTAFSVLLINAGVEFRLMKIVSALVFAAIPIALYWYVHKRYSLDKNVPRDDSYIKQRWDAFAHQVAAFIHSNTDLMVLTLFSDLYQVSLYSVYYMVVNGVKKFVTVFSSGIEAILGKMIAAKEQSKLLNGMNMYEWIINVISIVAFSSTAVLIIPFMQVYTKDFTDMNYIQPLFGYLLCVAFYFSCVRLPYQSVVEAAGHFKNTRNGAITEAVINIAVSLMLVKWLGCNGVAVGTVAAMLFRTVQYAIYASKIILQRSLMHIVKRFVVSAVNIGAIMFVYLKFGLNEILCNYSTAYSQWALEAVISLCIIGTVTVIINALIYPKIFVGVFKTIIKRL